MMPSANNIAMRVVAARSVIDFMKTYVATYAPEEHVSDMALEMIISCAIFIGQTEGRPMTAGDVSAITGIPRTTVVRKINAAERSGRITTARVGRRLVAYITRAYDPDVSEQIERTIRTVANRFKSVSESDTSPRDSKSFAR